MLPHLYLARDLLLIESASTAVDGAEFTCTGIISPVQSPVQHYHREHRGAGYRPAAENIAQSRAQEANRVYPAPASNTLTTPPVQSYLLRTPQAISCGFYYENECDELTQTKAT